MAFPRSSSSLRLLLECPKKRGERGKRLGREKPARRVGLSGRRSWKCATARAANVQSRAHSHTHVQTHRRVVREIREVTKFRAGRAHPSIRRARELLRHCRCISIRASSLNENPAGFGVQRRGARKGGKKNLIRLRNYLPANISLADCVSLPGSL